MKKTILICFMAASFGFLSCSGKEKQKDIPDEERVEMAPNEVVPVPEYKVVNGQIMPVDGKPMIVDFSATWCGPCKQLKPIFEKLAIDFRDRITFVTIDVDENPDLSVAYNVNAVPTIVFINKDGQVQDRITGFQNRDQLLAAINAYFGF